MSPELTSSSRISFRRRLATYADRFVRLPTAAFDLTERSGTYMRIAPASRGMLTLESYGTIDIPEGVISAGELKKEADFAAILKTWLSRQERPLRSSFFTVSLPEEKAFLRVIQIPNADTADIPTAVRREVAHQIPLPLNEILYDYEVVTPLVNHLDHLDVMLVAFPRAVVHPYVRAFKQAGMRLNALEIGSQAIARALVSDLRSMESKIILDVGRLHSRVILYAGAAIIHTATIDIGGQHMSEGIARALDVSLADADGLKEAHGLDRQIQNGALYGALMPRVSGLSHVLARASAYFRSHIVHAHGANPEIGLILLSGRDANMRGLDTYLGTLLKIPVRRADPFAAMRSRLSDAIPPLNRAEAMAYVTAIGLTLRDLT